MSSRFVGAEYYRKDIILRWYSPNRSKAYRLSQVKEWHTEAWRMGKENADMGVRFAKSVPTQWLNTQENSTKPAPSGTGQNTHAK